VNAEDWLKQDRECELVAFERDLDRGFAVQRGILAVILAALRWRASLTAEHQADVPTARLPCPLPPPGRP
jgi:hypothetical protein